MEWYLALPEAALNPPEKSQSRRSWSSSTEDVPDMAVSEPYMGNGLVRCTIGARSSPNPSIALSFCYIHFTA
jgi:hypothetical protein